MAKTEPQIVRFRALPGVKWIRASTFFAYVDTPWRFPSKQALWRYLGIGLERWKSGAGPDRVRMPSQVNRSRKSMILGAAKSSEEASRRPRERPAGCGGRPPTS
jgi:transposase